LNGEIVYIGSGAVERARGKTARSKAHLSVWEELKIELLHKELSVSEAKEIEQMLINEYWESGKLFNKVKGSNQSKGLYLKDIDNIVYYDEASPTFLRWKISHSKGKVVKDKPAGSISKYFRLMVNYKPVSISRIVYAINHRIDIPDNAVIDHIDGNKSNNRIENLRMCSSSENNRNRKHRLSNTGYQCIRIRGSIFTVNFIQQSKQIFVDFSFSRVIRKTTKKHYPTRELAFEAALAYRNSLVDQGLIVLTNKDELNGIN